MRTCAPVVSPRRSRSLFLPTNKRRLSADGSIEFARRLPYRVDARLSMRLVVGGGPLFPKGVVREHFHEQSAHHRPRLESALLRILRPVPIGQRNTGRRFVREFPGRVDERIEIAARIAVPCSV